MSPQVFWILRGISSKSRGQGHPCPMNDHKESHQTWGKALRAQSRGFLCCSVNKEDGTQKVKAEGTGHCSSCYLIGQRASGNELQCVQASFAVTAEDSLVFRWHFNRIVEEQQLVLSLIHFPELPLLWISGGWNMLAICLLI